MARQLTSAEIAKLAARKCARRIAVENVLGSIDPSLPRWVHLGNLSHDARLYRWNGPTVSAITAGIGLAYDGPERQLRRQKETWL